MAKSHSGPLIGITLDSEEPGGYSKFPWYALRQNYCSAVTAKGGVPLVLPHEPSAVDSYLDLRSEEHTSELQSLMRISYAVFCLQTTNKQRKYNYSRPTHY